MGSIERSVGIQPVGCLDRRSRSVCSKQGGDRGDVLGTTGVGRDAKDDVILILDDIPRDERAALPLNGS